MSKRQLLVILGVWVMVFLFLGFPSAWDKVFSLATGLIILVVASKVEKPRMIGNAPVSFVERKNGLSGEQGRVMNDTRPITSSDTPISS